MTEHKPLTAEEITETAVGQWTYRVDGPHREEINTFVHRLAEDLRAARAAREAAERERDEAREMHKAVCEELGEWIFKEGFGKLRADRERLTAECESLRAVVERLPKTADGVPVNSLDVLWQSHPEVKEPIMHREYIIDQVGAFVTFQKAQYLVSVHCYSTRAAAEAARLAGKESPDAR